ncbi:ABC transporter permease [Pseudonocardiaceae bacterium YIM PH 21723]|nr:ABC transporter permease [Pseudonocardiaceae bacterium YIM PH 21723]
MRVFHDTWLIYVRSMRQSLRNPVWVFIGLLQPVLYLFLFGPLTKLFVQSDPAYAGKPWQTMFVPGILLQLGLFVFMGVGFGLIAEYRAGVIERMRVSPVSRAALLLGRVGRDVTLLTVQAAILVLFGYLGGMDAPVGGMLLGMLVLVVLCTGMAAIGYAMGLTLKSEDALAPLANTLLVPVLLLSGIMLPMNAGPGWLQTIAKFNPFSWIVTAERRLFLGDFSSSSTITGILWALVIAALGVYLGTRTFQRENA